MKILITGGSGFVGSHLCNTLHKEYPNSTLHILDNSINFTTVEQQEEKYNAGFRQSLRSSVSKYFNINTVDSENVIQLINGEDYDVVYHLAAMPLASVAMKYPVKAFDAIVLGTQNLLEAIRLAKPTTKFIYISSSMVYGDFPHDGVVSEDNYCRPKDLYGTYKYMGEKVVGAYANNFLIPSLICRPSAVYGPGDSNGRVVHSILRNALTRQSFELVEPKITRLDFTYVEDLARGLTQLLELDTQSLEVFNITRGKSRSLSELGSIVRETLPGTKCFEIKNDETFRPRRGTLNNGKLKERTGYQLATDLEEAVPIYVDYLKGLYE